MLAYQHMLRQILMLGEKCDDRTGTGTTSLFGAQLKFDLSKGFPLVTTKKVHLKSIIHELLWFLRGDTNIKYLTDNGVNIWNEWGREFGALGPVYGHAMRYAPNFESDDVIQIKIRSDADSNYTQALPELKPAIECDLNSDEMWAIEKLESNHNSSYKVQFKSGFVCTISRPNWRQLKCHKAVDGFAKTVCDVGYLGHPKYVNERLYTLWRNMIVRCYDEAHPTFHNYGGRGVTVSPIWHSYENFQNTIASVPFFYLWEKGEDSIDIDKDYFGSKVYSPSTCIFLPAHLNVIMCDDALCIKGRLYTSWSHYERVSGIRTDYIRKQFSLGKNTTNLKIGDVSTIRPQEGFVYRKQMFVDQIENLISSIKSNPDSRRLIVSSWIPSVVPHMALPPCHMLFQVRIMGGKLHMRLDQRSADMFLGVPFNIASYSLLTMMLAQVTGYEVGTFTHHFGDAHIYDNHIDQVKEQLNREPKSRPEMRLNPDIKSIFDFKYEDFSLMGYESWPAIKAPVAV